MRARIKIQRRGERREYFTGGKNYLHLQSLLVILRADLLFHEIVVVSIQSD